MDARGSMRAVARDRNTYEGGFQNDEDRSWGPE